jgi:hypothetical protein
MTNASGRWVLAVILLLPGVITALSFHLLSSPLPSEADLAALPATAAGEPDDVSAPAALGETIYRASDAALFDARYLAGRLLIQSPEYRFRRDEPLVARVVLEMSRGDLPDDYEFMVWVTTGQGNFVADITPGWTVEADRITGRISVMSSPQWPTQLRLQAVLRIPGENAVQVSLATEVFEPVAVVKGTGQPFIEQGIWQIPLRVEVYEPGVVTVTATLTDEQGAVITHLHSRQRLETTGQALLHVRDTALTAEQKTSHLQLTDIQVRHISDRYSAPLGWGDSEKNRYTLPQLDALRSGVEVND